ALLLGFVLVQMACRCSWMLAELCLFLFGAMMACLHVRFLLVFVPFFAPILAVILARWVRVYDRGKDRFVLNGALIAAMVFAIVQYFPSRTQFQKILSANWPVDAVEYLIEHEIPGPMYNNYGFGGYLVWARGPEHKVFIDGRGDVYERGGVLRDYLHIAHVHLGALGVLRNYGIESCLIERDEPLATVLSASPEWKRIYADNVA